LLHWGPNFQCISFWRIFKAQTITYLNISEKWIKNEANENKQEGLILMITFTNLIYLEQRWKSSGEFSFNETLKENNRKHNTNS
jgi:hypothetical protein